MIRRYAQTLMRHRKAILIWAVCLFLVFTVVGFFVVPLVLKSVLTAQLTKALHREVAIREVRFNPFALSTTVRGLTVREAKDSDVFASFEELYLNLEASSVFWRGVVIREVRLTKPFVRLVRHPDETYNFSDLMPVSQTQPAAPTKPPRFSINNIRIIDGAADINDELAQTKHVVRDVDIGIPFLSNIPSYVETFVQPAVSARINETRYTIEGKTKPFADSHETSLEMNISDLDLPYYLAYIPKELRTFAMPSGRLDAKLAIVFVQQRGNEQSLIVRGDVGFRDVAINDRQGAAVVRVPKLSLGLASVEPLTRRAHVSRLVLDSPELTVRREKTGITNLETLVPKPAHAEKTTAKEGAAPGADVALDIDEISIAAAKVLFSDALPKTLFKTTLAPIDVKVAQLSTRPNTQGTYHVTLATEVKEQISLDGNVSLTPLLVDGKVSVQAVVLKKYAPYYSDVALFDIENGKLDVSSRYRYAQGEKEPEIAASEVAASISGLRLKRRDESEDFFRVPTFTVRDTAIDLTRRQVVIGGVSTQQGSLSVKRSADGQLDLQKLVAQPSPPQAPPASQATSGQKPWLLTLKRMTVHQYRIQVVDETPPEPVRVTVEDVRLQAENLSTAENSPPGKVSLGLRLDQGTVSLDGSVHVTPVSADLQVAVKELDIRPFQPYVAERLAVTITDGRLSTAGRMELTIKEPQGLQMKFRGETSLAKFGAIEKATSEDILKWNSLAFQDLSVDYNPTSVSAKKVALADYFARIGIQPNGTLNLREIVRQPEQPAAATPAAAAPATAAPNGPAQAQYTEPSSPSSPSSSAAPTDIHIDELALQGGRVSFTDRSVTPNYSAEMMELGGRVTGLSSVETTLADVELRGSLNNAAPLEVTGKINPLKEDLFVDLKARFTGMDLSPTSPYAGKYAGYTIEKGKLSFDVNYRINKRKLESANKVFIDQFTFGNKVESPVATRLPVKLAVALLKDRKGEIHLDLPVAGSLNDPQFSVWDVIWQIIGNLITKAVTSPFALLGAAFGGGEGLQFVEFDPGHADLTPDGAKKLDTLATALIEKPDLKLEITGYVDSEADREGLKQILLQRKVKAQKLNALLKKGAPAVPVDDVPVSREEHEDYLKLAYEAEKFPKPRNVIGLTKSLPVPEMEKLILTHIEVGPEELRQLAAQRANAVRDSILRAGKLAADRLFIVEPKSLTPEKKEKQRDSRVEFKIA